MGDKNMGAYNKFNVERVDGSTLAGGKHHLCKHFVLDLDHDVHAIPAMRAYMESCKKDYPFLYRDLQETLSKLEARRGES